ncbi:MAG TPA: TlpA disulfide reductase family protein [Kofleriaceae bacterium]|nr:TlpA disulfide reductase family protein [Kofleriaceae bacterium]
MNVGRTLVAILAVVAACGSPANSSQNRLSPPVALTFPALDGGTIDVAAYRGDIVVVHVFATWSPPALHDSQILVAAAASHRGQVRVIAIAMDSSGYRLVAAWRNAAKVHYLVGLATEAIRTGHTVLGPIHQVPITFVLDRRGRIAQRINGVLGDATLEAALAPLLADPSTP